MCHPASPCIVLVVLGCSSTAVSTTAPVSTPAPSSASAGPSLGAATPAPTRGVTAPPADTAPPAATLVAEGGDPVVGQLGTYAWRDGGSDSPWLPGAPIAVGAGEPLSLSLEPATGIASWRARSVPASADGPDGRGVTRRRFGFPGIRRAGCGHVDDRGPRRVRRRTGRCELLLAPGRHLAACRPGAARHASVATGCPAEKIETWASSGSITPKTFCSASVWAHDPQLSK